MLPDLSFLVPFVPDPLTPAIAAGLVVIAMFTSALTAAFGIGGGVTLLAIMAPLMPASVVLPVHGVVQFGSNLGRSIIMARHARWRMLIWFVVGALIGAPLGALIVTDLPDHWIKLAIGVFVIWSAIGKLPALGRGEASTLGVGGAISSFLTMFVGATGPFVIALLKQSGLPKEHLVATTAVAMVTQNTLKIIAFSALGFAFAAWLPLMAAMIASGFLGTVLGSRVLVRLPEAVFRRGLQVILLVIGVLILVEQLIRIVSAS